MNRARWEQIQTLFHDAAERPGPEQRVFLESACGDDPTLLTEVLALLEEDSRGASMLDEGVAHVAYQMVGDAAHASVQSGQFGPYRIKEMLGEGGMGLVYLAERDDLGNLVAIKVLRDAWLSPARRKRFASEQRMLARLNHPSIARLYDADTLENGTPWFVMEYVDGLPLTEYCRRHSCSVEERVRLLLLVCQAVQYAHQQALVHRDLKPSNILVKHDGSVRLLDFGIARQIESLDASVERTRTALRFMTPAYASPEQIRGESVGVQTDVYALGVILYELLAGRLPFDLSHKSEVEAAVIITMHDPPKPSLAAEEVAQKLNEGQLFPTVPKAAWADLDVLCLTAMHKDAKRRYQSAEALLRDLNHYLNGEPLEARPDTLRYTLGKFVYRHWAAVWASAIVGAILIGVVIFYTVRLTTARNAAQAQAQRALRIQRFMLNLFQGGDPSVAPADDLRVLTLLDRGAQEARGLDAEPAVQADLYETLGGIYEQVGKFEQADSLLQSSLAERKSLFGTDSPETAKSLLAVGSLRDAQAQYEESEKLLRQALEIDARHLPKNDPAIAQALLALGNVQEDRGAYDQSIVTLQQTVKLYSVPGSAPADLADSLYELANAHFYAGHYDKAEELNQRVLPIYKQIYGDRHPRVAAVLINLGAIRYDLGHYPEAERYDRQALDIVQTWYGKDNPETATDLTILARALVHQNRFDEATALLQQSLAIKERAFGKVHPSVASTLNELGSVALQENKYGDAAGYFERMADIYRAAYGEHHYLMGTALSNLGSVYSAEKQWSRAENLYRRAIVIFVQAQSATSVNTGIARIKLGRALLREKRYADAKIETQGGYDILVKQMDPKVSWLVNARKDLIEEYDALKQPGEVAKFRAEIAATQTEVSDIHSRK